jgi:transcriptional regulator with XRE-family HTH domain
MSEARESGAIPEWTLGWRLNRALDHAGVSVEGIAADLGVSRSTISRWINDRGAPPRTIYIREWALRCGVDYRWLRSGEIMATSADPRSEGFILTTCLSPARDLRLAA